MKKILVVDDDEGIVDSLSCILEDEGYEVDTTLQGKKAIEKVHNFQPNLIILDVLISGTDGREICREIKNAPSSKDIPVVMISAHPSARPEALQMGASDFIAKPFSLEKLLAIIDTQLKST